MYLKIEVKTESRISVTRTLYNYFIVTFSRLLISVTKTRIKYYNLMLSDGSYLLLLLTLNPQFNLYGGVVPGYSPGELLYSYTS